MDTTNVKIKAKPQSSKLKPASVDEEKLVEISSEMNPPIIMGTLKRKLYSAEFVSSFPKNKRVEMVVPERERPGRTARPWVIPTITADLYEISGGEMVTLRCLNL